MIMRMMFVAALIALQACATPFTPSQVPGYIPVTQPANDTPQFRLDQQACLNEMDKAWPQARQDNAAVIQFRRCLMGKGYRLLS
jgi:hypothetical protein